MRIKRNILFLIFFFFQCSSSSLKTEVRNVESAQIIEDGISIKISGHQFPYRINLKLTPTIPDKDDYPEFKSFVIDVNGKAEDHLIQLSVPAGIYYGLLTINNTEYLPPLYTDFSGLNIFWGFDVGETTLYGRGKIIETSLRSCEYKTSTINFPICQLNCGRLAIDSDNKIAIELKIDPVSDFSNGGTATIWLGGLFISLQTRSPAGILVPMLMGPIAFERKINHNLK